MSNDPARTPAAANTGERRASRRRVLRDPAARVAGAFLLFGALWILTSDRALEALVGSVEELSTFQTYKGWAFVAVTGVLLFAIVRREFRARVAAERRATNILESITDAFYAVDVDWRITYANGNAVRHFGRARPELIGQRVWDLFPATIGSDFYRRYHEAVASGEPVTVEAESIVNPGRYVEVRAYPTRDGLAVYVTDITDRRMLEQRLRRARKMEAVGRLAGELTHDFRNVLNVVTGNALLLRDDLPDDHPGRELLDDVLRATDGALERIRRLLVFSRDAQVRPEVVGVNAAVRDTEGLVRTALGSDIEFRVELAPLDRAVVVERGDLDQMMLNLAINARDAMPDGGSVTVTVDTVVVEEAATPWIPPDLEPGEYVVLSVADTGQGMDAATQERIFEPYFTTKDEGHGTGLGLATVYGIVDRLDGAIEVESRPDEGATFRIYLPVADVDRDGEGAAPEAVTA